MYPKPKRRVLCVTSHLDERELLSTLLAFEGYEAVTVGTAADALRLFYARHFDLFIIDEMLPGSSGAELAGHITSAEPRACVVMCSADTRQSVRWRCLQTGARAFFAKPYDIEALAECLRRLTEVASRKG